MLSHAKLSRYKRLQPVGITSTSRAMTLRRYLSDHADERKYRISRARIRVPNFF